MDLYDFVEYLNNSQKIKRNFINEIYSLKEIEFLLSFKHTLYDIDFHLFDEYYITLKLLPGNYDFMFFNCITNRFITASIVNGNSITFALYHSTFMKFSEIMNNVKNNYERKNKIQKLKNEIL